jgi:excisionase family DNA binding protein
MKKRQTGTPTPSTSTRVPATVRTNGKSDRLLTVGDVAERLGLSTRTIWALRAAGTIPAPIKIGANTRWRRSEIETYIRGLPAENR